MTARRDVRVAVPARVVTFLEGTQAAADLNRAAAGRTVESTDGELSRLIRTVRAGRMLADSSTSVRLDLSDLDALDEVASWLESAAADDAGEELDALADLNAARACRRRVSVARLLLDDGPTLDAFPDVRTPARAALDTAPPRAAAD